ncbi:MAG TPA: hypothetical protein VIY27_13800 [Myxococcota bacterium]
MKKRNIIMLVVVAAIFVVAGVLVVVGITTHEEPGLTNPDNAWDHTELTVGCRQYATGTVEECDAVRSAVSTINNRLGFPMMRYVDATATDIEVTLGVPSDGSLSEPGGDATLTGSGTTYEHCRVRTSNTGTSELLHLTLYHELACHCLGLAHDDFDSSICRAEQSSTPMGQFPPRLTDFDRGLLRERYAP